MKKDDKNRPQMTIHGGLKDTCPKAPSGYGIKGMASVNESDRMSTAPTPKSMASRDA